MMDEWGTTHSSRALHSLLCLLLGLHTTLNQVFYEGYKIH